MDIITLSLQQYFEEEDIPFRTEGGASDGDSTFTVIHIQNEDGYVVDLTIDIYPEDGNFIIKGCPRYVFDVEYLDNIRAFENKWNRTGMLSSIIVKEETGVVEPDSYTFELLVRGISEEIGMSGKLWHRYIGVAVNSTWDAWAQIDAIIDSFENKR